MNSGLGWSMNLNYKHRVLWPLKITFHVDVQQYEALDVDLNLWMGPHRLITLDRTFTLVGVYSNTILISLGGKKHLLICSRLSARSSGWAYILTTLLNFWELQPSILCLSCPSVTSGKLNQSLSGASSTTAVNFFTFFCLHYGSPLFSFKATFYLLTSDHTWMATSNRRFLFQLGDCYSPRPPSYLLNMIFMEEVDWFSSFLLCSC